MTNQPPADEALQNHLDYTRKRMGSRARERDVQRSLRWVGGWGWVGGSRWRPR